MANQRKLTLQDILSDIERKDLKAYIIQYAKKDKNFEIAMKAHFISRVATGDEDKKYQKILGAIIKPKTLSNNKIALRQKKLIDIVLQDLTFQMDDLLSTENYREAHYVIKNCLDKIAYLQHKYLWQDKQIESYRVKFIAGLEHLLVTDMAPRLRVLVEAAIHENIMKSYYVPAHHGLCHLVIKHELANKAEKSLLMNHLVEKYQNGNQSDDMVQAIITLSVPIKQNAKKVLQTINHKILFSNFIELIEANQPDVVAFYLDNKNLGYTYNVELLHCLFLHQKNDHQQLDKALLALSDKKLDADATGKLVNKLSPLYLKNAYQRLQPWITSLTFRTSCNLYLRAEAYDVLLQKIENKNDIEWLRVYDQTLIEQGYLEEVEALYLTIITAYLDDHIGEKAAEYMARVSHRLHSISHQAMLHNIQKALYKRYSHRDSLASKI